MTILEECWDCCPESSALSSKEVLIIDEQWARYGEDFCSFGEDHVSIDLKELASNRPHTFMVI